MLEDQETVLMDQLQPSQHGEAPEPWYNVNGRFVRASEAAVPADDRGLLYGDGCFESLGIWGGRMVQLDQSLARIRRSARMLRIDLPPTEELRKVVLDTASRNGMDRLPSGYLRLVVTRGCGMGVAIPPDMGKPNVLVVARTKVKDYRELPVVRAAVTTHVRQTPTVLDPRIKSLNYLAGVLAALEAKAAGAELGLLRDAAGYICEAHAMNVLCVKDGTVLSPPIGGALAGITAANVSLIAQQRGYGWVERPLTVYDFANADEAFATCSSSGVMAIAAIDDFSLPTPVPGPIASELHAGYIEAAFAGGVPVEPWTD
jgi:branched-chain amino acid aminotransferase